MGRREDAFCIYSRRYLRWILGLVGDIFVTLLAVPARCFPTYLIPFTVLWSGTMASSTPLSLFPSAPQPLPSAQQPQPRKSSLKKPKSAFDTPAAPGELRGVAVQINTTPASPKLVVSPAKDQFKHSLFCEPDSNGQKLSTQRIARRRGPTPRRGSDASSITSASPLIDLTTPVSAKDDQSVSLPEPTMSAQPVNMNAPFQQQQAPANLVITQHASVNTDTLISPGGDTISPLPDKLFFNNTSPRQAEFPPSKSMRSVSPSLMRSNSTATTAVPPYSPPAARSIFPQYDPTVPLHDQHYYPTARSPTPTLPYDKVSKIERPVEQVQTLKRLDSGVALVEGYEHIPHANSEDLQAIWNASHGIFPVSGRKVQLGLLQPRNRGTALAIGSSRGDVLYSMDKDLAPAPTKESMPFKQLLITRHHPQKPDGLPSPVAKLGLPDTNKLNKEKGNDVVTIFPQTAAVQAIETIANSPVAAEIATFDPGAKSPEAARLAQDAVSEAHRRYRCELVRTTRKRDSLGAVTASYKLEHPLLDSFAITITKSTDGRHSCDPRAKISLHHPSATPAAVTAETLVLAFLDFGRDACVLDTPGLLALESEYIIDTVICALLAVAVIENDALVAETLTFAAPPKSPLPLSGKQKSRLGSRRSSVSPDSDGKKAKKLSKKDRKKGKEGEFGGEQVDLPVVTQGALALLGFSFKTAVFLLETGVKITAGVVIGVSHLASKANNK